MREGLNFIVPIAERVIQVDVKVQPHPFKEIDASSKEYQMVKIPHSAFRISIARPSQKIEGASWFCPEGPCLRAWHRGEGYR